MKFLNNHVKFLNKRVKFLLIYGFNQNGRKQIGRETRGKKRRRSKKDEKGMHDPRSESRQQFTQIKFIDPREKLSIMHINEQKERRQKNLIDKRAENSKREKEEKKDKNP